MSISIVFARALLAELQDRGLDGLGLLQRSGVDAARLSDIRESLRTHESESLVRNAVAVTRDPALGLAIGGRRSGCTFQLFGQLLRTQPTLRDAIATHMKFSGLVARGPTWSLVEQGTLAHFSLAPRLPFGPLRTFMMEYGITASVRICMPYFPRAVNAQESLLHEVHFQHPTPDHAATYKTFFRCPVLFGQPNNALVFPRALLDHPQQMADPTVSRMLQEMAERLLREQSGNEQVHERVRLLLRYTMDLQTINSSQIARAVGLTLRTLRRRLALEGQSLSMLVDEARCRVACDALRRADTTLPEVAELVGYADPSAFFRAFKRWTGQTPGEYRRRALADGAALRDAQG